jgi:hypothetical protein
MFAENRGADLGANEPAQAAAGGNMIEQMPIKDAREPRRPDRRMASSGVVTDKRRADWLGSPRTRGISLRKLCNRLESSARHQDAVDDMDDSVRLVDVCDRHLRRAAF